MARLSLGIQGSRRQKPFNLYCLLFDDLAMLDMVEFLLQTRNKGDSVHVGSQLRETFSESLDIYTQKFTSLRVLIVE